MNEIPHITSRDNQRLVLARKVRDGHSVGSIFIEGKRLTLEALRSELEISTCFMSQRFADSNENAEILDLLEQSAGLIFALPDRVFRTIAATENSQGVIVVAERPASSLEIIEQNLGAHLSLPIVLLLLRANNPSNLGAVLRTAEASGVAGVIISKGSTDAFSPKALRASMGSAFRIPIWTGPDFETVITWTEKTGLRPTAIGAVSKSSYTNADLRVPRLLIFGSEAHGIGNAEMDKINESLYVPMENDVESLNLAVAAGVILFEAKRQNSEY
jgi:TrmH family RNA methyltransferase